MSDVIAYSTGTIVPNIIDGYSSTRPGGTVVHPIAGSSSPDVTLRPAGTRTGTLRLVFEDEAESAAAEAALCAPEIFTLTSTDRPTLPMSFVIPESGRIERELDDGTRDAWVLRIDFQEVAP